MTDAGDGTATGGRGVDGGGAVAGPSHVGDAVPALVDALLAAPLASASSATRVLCIDGRAGAGKTTLAALLEREMLERGHDVETVHMDDVYEGWGGLLRAGETLVADVVVPVRDGVPGRYRRYDWARGERAEAVVVRPADVLLVEGCGSAPPAADPDLLVYVTAPHALRLQRGLARDGEDAREHWLAFMADEELLAARDRTRERAHVVLDEVGEVLGWAPPAADAAVGRSTDA